MIALGALFWTTTSDGALPPTPPLPPGAGSSGGDAQWTPPGWLLDMLEDEERLAREAKKVKRQIKQLATRKAELQAQIAKPSQRIDYGALIAAVQDIANRLQALLDTYRLIQRALDELDEAEEEGELMMVMSTVWTLQ